MSEFQVVGFLNEETEITGGESSRYVTGIYSQSVMALKSKNQALKAMHASICSWIHDLIIGESRKDLAIFANECWIIILKYDAQPWLEMLNRDEKRYDDVVEFVK